MANRYQIENEKEVIREIQRYLLAITPADSNPGISKNGVYDTPTEQAVRQFQIDAGLPETGIVDLTTWNLIWRAYDLDRDQHDFADIPEITAFDMYIGATGYEIIVLQALLGEFSKVYPNVSRPAITGQFGLTTADAVRAMQRNYGLYADGIVTLPLWNRMLRDNTAEKQILQYSHIFND